MHRLLAFMLLLSLSLAGRAHAATEWVLILDNSASMSVGMKVQDQNGVHELTANDPDRLSVLATLIFRALLDNSDHLTIVTFQGGAVGRYRELAATPDAIRGLRFDQSTPFTGPFKRAREILIASQLPERALLLVTDGAPSEDDPLTPDQARALLGLDTPPQVFDLVSLGLTGGHTEISDLQRQFLAPLGNLKQIENASGLVTAFTDVFAAHIRSRPQTGRLASGESFTFPVGRYVTEVMVDMASEGRTGPFETALTADGESIAPVEESGDNRCASPPCHTYHVTKAPHDPDRQTRWTLRLARSSGPVAYGVILRYDLAADFVRAPSTARMGEEVEVAARLTFRGRTFNDRAFFEADGFEAMLMLGDAKVPLERKDDGTFVGRIRPSALGVQRLRAHFQNRWLSLDAGGDLKVEGWLPLALRVHPNPVDFGTWQGERLPTRRCVDLDLAGSENHRTVPLEAIGEGLPDGATLDGTAAPLLLDGDRANVCLVVRGCCGDVEAPTAAHLIVRGRDPHYQSSAASVPLTFRAQRTPFLVCWWRVIAAVSGTLFFLFVLGGIVRPRDFDADEMIRLAKTEPALARATARRLRELPGGRRGFYRDARVGFDGSGNAATPKGAVLVIRAARGEPVVTVRGSVEMKDLRTHKWQAVTETNSIRKGIVYRSGDFCFRLG